MKTSHIKQFSETPTATSRGPARSRAEIATEFRPNLAESGPAKMFATQNSLPGEVRVAMVRLLNFCLIDALCLALKMKLAHWNVKGPRFSQLHELFDKFYDETTEWADLLAERAVQLGGVAEATLPNLAKETRLPDNNPDLALGESHLDALSVSLSVFGRNVRSAIDTAAKVGDAVTVDLLTQVTRDVDKMLWTTEAHFQSEL